MKKELLDEIINDAVLRQSLARLSFYYFFHIYFGNYITCETASFQKEIIEIAEDLDQKLAVIVSFRGSAKSTLISLAYAIWAVVGKQNLKFVLIISQVQNQSKQLLANIKKEFETNDLLQKDFGTFEEQSEDWRANSLVLPKYDAKIMAASTGESIRGYRYGSHRPQLIIFDDIEDNDSVRTKDSRDKTYEFVTSDAIPAGDTNTKTIIIGNLLHQDSVIMRFKNEIENGARSGIFRSYPVVDKNGDSLWPSQYPNKQSIIALEKRIGNDRMYRQEFLLEIVSAEDQIIERSWIKYYDEIPPFIGDNFRFTVTGVDLAIIEKDTADFTAFVCAHVFGYEEDLRIYILPNPVNKRMGFSAQEEELKGLVESLGGKDNVKIFIENVGYQQAFVEILQKQYYDAKGVSVNSASKRERLAFISGMVKAGKVLFPREGTEDLINQLVGFGIEKHDDMADAFSILIKKAREENKGCNVEMINMSMSIQEAAYRQATSVKEVWE